MIFESYSEVTPEQIAEIILCNLFIEDSTEGDRCIRYKVIGQLHRNTFYVLQPEIEKQWPSQVQESRRHRGKQCPLVL